MAPHTHSDPGEVAGRTGCDEVLRGRRQRVLGALSCLAQLQALVLLCLVCFFLNQEGTRAFLAPSVSEAEAQKMKKGVHIQPEQSGLAGGVGAGGGEDPIPLSPDSFIP